MSTAFLIQNDLPDAPRTIPLAKGECRVGRVVQADIVLNNPSISRQHAVIQRSREGFVVIDSNSHNGTRVNGVAVARRLLRDGDHLRFGDVELVFHESDESDERPAQVAEKGKAPAPPDNEPVSGTTCSLFTTGTRDTQHWESANSWQVINLFDLCARTEIDTVLQLIVNNLAGIQRIRKVCLTLMPVFMDGREKWIKSGPSASRPGVCYSEEMLQEVARTGSAKSVIGGAWSAGVQDNSTPDAVCLPIIIQGHPGGCLYIEGNDGLSRETIQGATAGAKAISLGLTIWKSAVHAGSPAVTPASASVTIIGKSQVLQQAMRLAEKAAHSDATVLIRGETGTGKELFARLVYEDSPRRSAPFIPVHCSAMEETLLGSALFGHEKGAYTGAVGMKKGLFEKADRGTIFLDEIGDLSLAMQVKLLRVLQEGEFMRLGGNAPIRVDVRVIAATNRNLEKAVREQTFREDLYYRLKVIELSLPALRERREDIPELIRHFIQELSAAANPSATRIAEDALAALARYDWPGNVRELRNVIERALVLTAGDEISLEDLPPEMASGTLPPKSEETVAHPPGKAARLDEAERRHIEGVLVECEGNKVAAARRLGISRSTLYEKLKVRS